MSDRFSGRLRSTALAACLVAAAVVVGGASAATTATAPTNGCPPTIEGSLIVGKTVSAGNGCWSNSPTSFTYKWVRCNDQTATTCAPIASTRSYTLTSSDVGHSLIVYVTATNSAGSTGPVNSKPSGLVSAAAAPQFKTRPTITGKPEVGQALAVKVGTFGGGTPLKLTFQWQTCDQAGAACSNVTGATSATYGIRAADAGKTIRVEVTAANDYGSAKQTSDRTTVVQSIAQPVALTTTITASRAVTTCCQRVRLSGTVSSHEAGQSVVILARANDDVAATAYRFVRTDANGDWTLTVRPTVKTTYLAQAGAEPSSGVTINVRPRVGLGHSGRLWTVKVTGRDSFAGSLVLLQRRAGNHWITVQRVVLNINSIAHFKTNLRHGRWTLRAYVPSRETGPGYLAGTSHTLNIKA